MRVATRDLYRLAAVRRTALPLENVVVDPCRDLDPEGDEELPEEVVDQTGQHCPAKRGQEVIDDTPCSCESCRTDLRQTGQQRRKLRAINEPRERQRDDQADSDDDGRSQQPPLDDITHYYHRPLAP